MSSLEVPMNPNFSSGPCAKRPGWNVSVLKNALVGRSHRSKESLEKINKVIADIKTILDLPKNYEVALVGGSDTGAFEMAMWNLLGHKPVEILAWEAFGNDWITDVVEQLKIKNTKLVQSDYGLLPNLKNICFDNDVVFTWNGTTSGVKIPNGEWIKENRKGLTLCDATSAVFAMDLPWNNLDVTTFSWQKVLGGEAQHGVIILSKRAVDRLEEYNPPWPIPKLFRITKEGKFQTKIFQGNTINTPSLICIEDAIDALNWVKKIGGLKEMINRSANNLKIIEKWVVNTKWIDFVAEKKETRSSTSICLKIVDPWFISLSNEDKSNIIQFVSEMLAKYKVAYDINSYPSAPSGIRIWGGGTIEKKNIELLLPWLDWIWQKVKIKYN